MDAPVHADYRDAISVAHRHHNCKERAFLPQDNRKALLHSFGWTRHNRRSADCVGIERHERAYHVREERAIARICPLRLVKEPFFRGIRVGFRATVIPIIQDRLKPVRLRAIPWLILAVEFLMRPPAPANVVLVAGSRRTAIGRIWRALLAGFAFPKRNVIGRAQTAIVSSATGGRIAVEGDAEVFVPIHGS